MPDRIPFSLYDSSIAPAISWGRFPIVRWAKAVAIACVVLFLLFKLFFLIGFLSPVFSDEAVAMFLGLASIAFALGAVFAQAHFFFEIHGKHHAPRSSLKDSLLSNAAECLSFESARAADRALSFARRQKTPQVSSDHLLYFLLADNPDLGFVFIRANLDVRGIQKLLYGKITPKRGSPFSISFWRKEEVLWTDDFLAAVKEAVLTAERHGHTRAEATDLLAALCLHNGILRDALVQADLRQRDVENLVWWLENLQRRIALARRFWGKKNLMRHGTIAKEWGAGYTVILDRYSTDWSVTIRRRGPEKVIGHEDQIEQIERILGRDELNNVLVVGEPGSGRDSAVHAVAQKIFFGESLEGLNWKHVIELDMVSLLARTEGTEEVEGLLDTIFAECAQAGNVILVINDFHNYTGGAARPGAVDISGVLARYLHLPQFQIVAVTSFEGLHRYVELNPYLASLFEKVEIKELSLEETILVLEQAALALERKHKRFVTYPAIREIAEGAGRYIQGVPFPRKALDLLDDVMVWAAQNTKSSFVLADHVARVLTERTQIPVGALEQHERETLLGLENLIHQRIVNQEEAVREVASALRRARAEVSARRGPMGTFLFLGPTGVGKTETSKALADIYFGSESRMIRLDMSEFQNPQDLSRLLGSREEDGLLTTAVRENPFALLLLDEIEKAHSNIHNLFLQVLDEGWVTDGVGRKVDFSNTIIIATSNAGYQVILEAIKSQEQWVNVKGKLLDFLFQNAIFRPEFLNRFDAVVVFAPLNHEHLVAIAELLLRKIKKNLMEKGIEFVITDALKEKVAELGYDPRFGAREMRRVLQDKVENAIASALLSQELKRGSSFQVNPEKFAVEML